MTKKLVIEKHQIMLTEIKVMFIYIKEYKNYILNYILFVNVFLQLIQVKNTVAGSSEERV